MNRYSRMELVEACAHVRKALDRLTAQVIDGHGTDLDELHQRRAYGRGERADTTDDWGEWVPHMFIAAMEEEVLDAVIYMAESARRKAAG